MGDRIHEGGANTAQIRSNGYAERARSNMSSPSSGSRDARWSPISCSRKRVCLGRRVSASGRSTLCL